MTLSSQEEKSFQIFKRQYLQLVDPKDLRWPKKESLRRLEAQTWLHEQLFSVDALQFPPPERYQLRVLKRLMELVEESIEDPDEDDISNELSSTFAKLMSKKLPPESVAAQTPSYVTYTFPSDRENDLSVTLLESRSVIFASGTTGLRTWEAALHFGNYLVTHGQHIVRGKRILELGAGTGLLSILCARCLGAIHVTATDGDDGVVQGLDTNIFLNSLQQNQLVDARLLRWGRALEEDESGEQRKIDVVIGADVTYDTSAIPSLVSTLRELFTFNMDLDVLIAVTIRKMDTFAAFLVACGTCTAKPIPQLWRFLPHQASSRVLLQDYGKG